MRTIAVCSGKGGVGKTTIATNLSILLSQIGKKVVLVDADISMANIGIVLGIDRVPISLHNVLAGENEITDAVYEGPARVKYVPCGLSIDGLKKIDFARFAAAIARLEKNADYVIIDCPPGLEPQTQQVLRTSKELIIVVTPDPPALADGLKVKQFANKAGIKVAGVVVNKVRGAKEEVRTSEIEALMGSKVISSIPEDADVHVSTEKQSPLMLGNQGSPAGLGLKRLAASISGEKFEMTPQVKKSFFQSLMDSLFGKRK